MLVSDGADNSADFDAAKIAEIASFGVPVHTVGVGAETMPNDLEIEDVQLPSVGLAGLDGQRAGQHPPQRGDARAAQGLRRRRDSRVRSHPAAGHHGRHDALGRHRSRRGRRARLAVRARRTARRDERHQQLAPAPDGGAGAAATHLIYRGRAALGVQVHSPRDRRGAGRARREPAQDDAEQVLPPGRRVATKSSPTVSRPRSSSCFATTP